MSGVGAPGTAQGRGPVVLEMPAPRATGGSSPVIAILDTGLGQHPWFPDGSPLVARDPRANGSPIGLRFAPDEDPENIGVTIDRVNGALDPLAGHGTFVAGVVRQHCPDARLVIVPVMYGDGAADEADVIEALNGLAIYHWSALDGKADHAPVDVVNLSLGYYHETPQSVDEEGALFDVLRTLAADGVAVIAAAGNGGTTERFWPAALAETTPAGVPFTSVGATNPADASVAVFSNTGSWVSTYSAGVAVVSTMPVTLEGSLRSDVAVAATGSDPARATPDPDSYPSGFGVWSGTSFSCPCCVGEVAAVLARSPLAKRRDERIKQVSAAVAEVVGGGS